MIALVPLGQVERLAYEDAFLIEDLVTSRITFITGEPKAGKSALVAGMVRALTEGHEEFIGQKVLKQVDHVVYGFSDDAADAELRERFEGTAARERISVLPIHALSDDDWTNLPEKLVEVRADVFVVDTVLGSLGADDDIAQSLVATKVIARLRPIAEAGVPVIAVTHTPKGNVEGLSVASGVMGGRAMAAGGRGIVALRKSAGGFRRIQTSINRARVDLDVKVSLRPECEGSEVPVWQRMDRREKGPVVNWRGLADRLVAEQPGGSRTAVFDALATEVGCSRPTVTKHLDGLVELHEGAWRRTPAHLADDLAVA